LKSLHEVVVRNRLEQLRKRQRDEALQAQEELLAGVAKSASKKYGTAVPAVEIETVQEEVVPVEEIEPYDRSMSPGLLDITKLPAEERQIDILTEEEDRRALVSSTYLQFYLVYCVEHQIHSSNNAVQLQLPDSSLKPLSRPQKFMIQKQRVVPTLHLRLYTGKKLNETSMKKRNYSTWRRTSSIPRHTIGKTSIDRGNRGTSTVCTPGMSGINITKRIMSSSSCIHSPFMWTDICIIARTTLRRKSYKVTKCGLTKFVTCYAWNSLLV
jgi:hypothetical protein